MEKIQSKRVKNIVRGIIQAQSNDDLRRTMNSLRATATERDAYQAYQYLYDGRFGKKSPLPAAFPDDPSRFPEHIYFEPVSFIRELSYHRVAYEKNLPKLMQAIAKLGTINSAIILGDVRTLTDTLSTFGSEFGYSLILLKKLLAVKHLLIKDDALQSVLQTNLEKYRYPHGQILLRAFEDTVDHNVDYVTVRRTFTSYIRDGYIKRPVDKIVLENFFNPLTASSQVAAERLQALSCYSCLDSLIYLLSNKAAFKDILNEKEYETYEVTIPGPLKEQSYLSKKTQEIARISPLIDGEPHFKEYWFFCQTSNFEDIPEVYNYRLSIEKLLGNRLGSLVPQLGIDLDKLSINMERMDVRNFWAASCSDELDIASIHPSSCGNFHRSVYLIWLITKGFEISPLSGYEFLKLMNITVDVAKILDSEEIQRYFPNIGNDPLHRCLTSALINDCIESDRSEHRLRKEMQALLKRDYGGSILKFVQYLQVHAPWVAEYFFYTCSEAFLTKFYDLFQNNSEVIETRCALLLWYADTYDDQDARSRAQSLKLDLKLQGVRGDIDDNRIIVDQARFFNWMSEKILGDIRNIAFSMTQEEKRKNTADGDLKNPVTVIKNPELKLASIIDRCFHEFCVNKNYGVESYIGRRIRHGSLDGTMLVDVQELIKEKKNANSFDQNFEAELDAWLIAYRNAVRYIGGSLLQIHHPKAHKKGQIVPTVTCAHKKPLLRSCIADVEESLRLDDIPTALEYIYQYSWLFLEADLTELRGKLVELRSNLMLDARGKDDNKRRCTREINRVTQAKFERLSVWLQRPTNITPTTSLNLLMEAVLIEVKEQHPNFRPTVKTDGDMDINLYGHGYHFFYDILQILIQNIADHGVANSIIDFSFKNDSNTGISTLKVTSQVNDTQGLKEKIDALFEADISDAMSEFQNSGIKKIRVLERDLREIKAFRYEYGEKTLTAVIDMQIVRS